MGRDIPRYSQDSHDCQDYLSQEHQRTSRKGVFSGFPVLSALFGSWPWYRSNRESWWDRSPSHGSFFAIPVLQAQAKHGESTRSSLVWNMRIYVVDIGHVTQRSLSNTLTWPVTPWTSLGKTDRMRFPRQVALIATADPSRNWSGTSGDQRRCSKKSKNKNIVITCNHKQ